MLQSTQQFYGDKLGATDGEIGRVKGFAFDDPSWRIGELVIKTGHRFSGREVQIPLNKVQRISHERSTVPMNLRRAAIEPSSAYLRPQRGRSPEPIKPGLPL